ncbi:hypothetical protein RFI_07060 [Reticulomyxa filosa]|uniref:PARG catalytic Macro domain-containing protein n=1 Tax=Reticulomyxa filosa TaxID=46433 RepID=X6NVM2_RETFI|nr:hypothetical protein RFI_07060 [Reticulomyxa filosa]|eukprot:ETO30061.1 hypothetical protein RFI_07060 [Reticulomyxa filosa]
MCWSKYFDFARETGVDSKWFKEQVITIHRRCLSTEQCDNIFSDKMLTNCDKKLPKMHIRDDGKIEEEKEALHADFANKFIGGGVLTGGNVQEEILFTVNPECLITMLLSPMVFYFIFILLNPKKKKIYIYIYTYIYMNETIVILGTRQYFDYTGYGSRFQYNGLHQYQLRESESKDKDSGESATDTNNGDEKVDVLRFCQKKPNRLATGIVCFDALEFPGDKQIQPKFLLRELVKAYVAFQCDEVLLADERFGRVIATGNWGCGMFGGNKQIKSLLQWIAATLAAKEIAYFTFAKFEKDKQLSKLSEVVNAMVQKEITVGQLWQALCNTNVRERFTYGSKSLFSLLNERLKLNISSL